MYLPSMDYASLSSPLQGTRMKVGVQHSSELQGRVGGKVEGRSVRQVATCPENTTDY